MTQDQISQILRGATLFHSFTDKGLGFMASIARPQTLPAGTPLFVQHMMGEALYIVASGSIQLSVGQGAAAQPLTSVGPGASLGEVAVLRGGPRQCTAIAEVESTVLEISRRDLAQLQREKPQACLKLMINIVEQVGQRLRELEPELSALVQQNIGA